MHCGNHLGSRTVKRLHFAPRHFLMAKKQKRAPRLFIFVHDERMEKLHYVYILDSAPHLFIGVTGDLEKRVAQPRRKLVWFEPYADLSCAIEREKQLKKWNRAWKSKLVSNHNPEWRDLSHEFAGQFLAAQACPSKLGMNDAHGREHREERRRRYRVV